jgi:hypothetical protein
MQILSKSKTSINLIFSWKQGFIYLFGVIYYYYFFSEKRPVGTFLELVSSVFICLFLLTGPDVSLNFFILICIKDNMQSFSGISFEIKTSV